MRKHKKAQSIRPPGQEMNFWEGLETMRSHIWKTGSHVALWSEVAKWPAKMPKLEREVTFFDAVLKASWTAAIVATAALYCDTDSALTLRKLLKLGREINPRTGEPFLPIGQEAGIARTITDAEKCFPEIRLLRHHFEAHVSKDLVIPDAWNHEGPARKHLGTVFLKGREAFTTMELAATGKTHPFPDFAAEIDEDLHTIMSSYQHLRVKPKRPTR